MCIICVKGRGVKLPKDEVLRTCFNNNPHGAGFAYWRPGDKEVSIKKGFMTYAKFIKAYESMKFTRADVLVIHFRLATHGLSDEGNCHPFPLSGRTDDLRAVNFKASIVVAHNGIFSSMPTHNVLSDTQKFIVRILADKPIVDNLESVSVSELLTGYCGSSSKLAFLKADGSNVLMGKWKKSKGLRFSNDGFLARETWIYPNYSASKSNKYQYLSAESWDFGSCEICGEKQGVSWNINFSGTLCTTCSSDYLSYA